MLSSNALTLEQLDTFLASMYIEIDPTESSTFHRNSIYKLSWKGSGWRHRIPYAAHFPQASNLSQQRTRKLKQHGIMNIHNWSAQSSTLPLSVAPTYPMLLASYHGLSASGTTPTGLLPSTCSGTSRAQHDCA